MPSAGVAGGLGVKYITSLPVLLKGLSNGENGVAVYWDGGEWVLGGRNQEFSFGSDI